MRGMRALGEKKRVRSSFAARGGATRAPMRALHGSGENARRAAFRGSSGSLRVLAMTIKVPLQIERAPKFGAKKTRHKASEPGFFCKKAGLRIQKHQPNPLTRFGQSLRPFTAGSGILCRNSGFRKKNPYFCGKNLREAGLL